MATVRQRQMEMNREIDKINYAIDKGWISLKKGDMLIKKLYKKYKFPYE